MAYYLSTSIPQINNDLSYDALTIVCPSSNESNATTAAPCPSNGPTY